MRIRNLNYLLIWPVFFAFVVTTYATDNSKKIDEGKRCYVLKSLVAEEFRHSSLGFSFSRDVCVDSLHDSFEECVKTSKELGKRGEEGHVVFTDESLKPACRKHYPK